MESAGTSAGWAVGTRQMLSLPWLTPGRGQAVPPRKGPWAGLKGPGLARTWSGWEPWLICRGVGEPGAEAPWVPMTHGGQAGQESSPRATGSCPPEDPALGLCSLALLGR